MRRLCPRRLGSFVQANAQRLLLLLSLTLLVLCAAINSVRLDTDLSSWIHRTTRIDNELQAIETAIGEGSGTNSLLLLQTPKATSSKTHNKNQQHASHHSSYHKRKIINAQRDSSARGNNNNNNNNDNDDVASFENDILSVDSLMIHLEALAIATHITIDLFDISWSLKDLCFSPTLPDYEVPFVNQMLDHLMPCAIKTPLDCFWEGSKLMGPEQEVRVSSLGPKLKWTSLNPLLMIEAKRRAHPHASFPYDALVNWMKRTGISSGYQDKPCLDPSDPNCPTSAPNKLSGEMPNVAVELTNGCHGLAAKQMHWREEEIVGGVQYNRTGYIVRASALQSTIQLMGERDVYDYWRKTSKVQDINNWSTDKAKQVLELWQKRFKDELAQFMRTSVASSAYLIHALAPKSMMEPIDSGSVMDLTNFKLSVLFFTLAACILFPSFDAASSSSGKQKFSDDDEPKTKPSKGHATSTNNNDNDEEEDEDTKHISRFRIILLALVTSLLVTLTFVASLGLSSFMNLPFNMMTTQILPPLALYYGIRQSLLIANIYSRHFTEAAHDHANLGTRCLDEILPVIFTEATTLIVPLVVASIIPVQGTRVFTLQAITYIALSTMTATLLVPALITTILAQGSSSLTQSSKEADASEKCTIYMKYKTSSNHHRPSSKSRNSSTKSCEDLNDDSERPFTVEDFIHSRLQEDLRYIRADSQQPININFSAELRPSSTRTSLKLTATRPAASLSASSTTVTANARSAPKLQTRERRQQTDDVVDEQQVSHLPDLIQTWSRGGAMLTTESDLEEESEDDASSASVKECDKDSDSDDEDGIIEDSLEEKLEQPKLSVQRQLHTILISNRICQALVCLIGSLMFVAALLQIPNVRYGLHLRDIVLRGSPDYDSLMIQERYFPVYNSYIITGADFDYPNNQRLLYEFNERISQVDGVVRDDPQGNAVGGTTTTSVGAPTKFWLVHFRDWLLELQESFDLDRNRSAITSEGWSPDASDASKLAYKLLAQTGRIDNPIDKRQVETSRLVDTRTGLINPKAFYYYLTAWVMVDAFTYSNSEANFKPEPRTWNENAEDLRIERARPLTYAQIPILLKLPETEDALTTIVQLRGISQAFAQLGLPNFPTGIPFVFWDHFINLDIMTIGAYSVIVGIYVSLACVALGNLSLALVLVGPSLLTGVELFGLLGLFSIEFNTIVAIILLGCMGTSAIQTIHYIMNYRCGQGDSITRLDQSFNQSFRTILTSIALLLISACIYASSKIDFMTKYSLVIYCLTAISCLNSLVLTPVLMALFAPKVQSIEREETPKPERVLIPDSDGKCDISRIIKSYQADRQTMTTRGGVSHKKQGKRKKRRNLQRVQSDISLSTISEEPQLESRACDSKIDLSIRC